MPASKQKRTEPKVRVAVEWPELPNVADQAAMAKWYYDLRNAVDNELDKLTQAVDT
jgi:hypothetical protein